ncbi:hypothetical protein GDO86_018180 [Hymenochirus boettgeri]|uniref:Uncharacterized protein n=1 Tax=Hymenochirus boettgeri TaxID=247094 RepID=A0A8T2IGE2_9PIPI|nr:hypothetical protein GDO86_018180 [Hymenochirus boettgeri]
MASLLFLCAQKVVCDHRSSRLALDTLPGELYPVLFQAAFVGKKTLVLQDLVRRWPFPVLSFQKLLRGDGPSDAVPPTDKPSKLCVQAVILGVTSYLNDAVANGSSGGPAG